MKQFLSAVVLVGIMSLMLSQIGFAAEFEVICPPNEGTSPDGKFADEPLLRNQKNGKIKRIKNVQRRAVAVLACQGMKVSVLDEIPECTEQEAAKCSACWNDPANTWCCTKVNSSGVPDCGSTSSQCTYTPCGTGCADTCAKPLPNPGGATNIKITNSTSSPVDIAFITAAAKADSACTDAARMLSYQDIADANSWCKDPTPEGGPNGGFCTGTVPANGSLTVNRPAGSDPSNPKCLSGAVMLGGKLSCPTQAYPNGFTQGEFTLNPTDTSIEATDISLVNGVNYKLSINLPGDAWSIQDNGGPISGTVGPNGAEGSNIGAPGIFPVNCTDCIQLVGESVCPSFPDPPVCQNARICNIQRGWTGGILEFVIGDVIP